MQKGVRKKMTESEAIKRVKGYLTDCLPTDCYEEVEEVINALEQEPKTEQFAKWVATEIFDDMWEYNKDSFAEIACRKLAKLGIVRAKGDEWELVEPQEGEEV